MTSTIILLAKTFTRSEVLNAALIAIIMSSFISLLAILAAFLHPHRFWWKLVAILTACEVALGVLAAVIDKLGLFPTTIHK